MSLVPVHGPTMWGYVTLAESDHIIVHVLNEYELEFKAKSISDLDISEEPYIWDFGDGTQVVNGRYVSHTFAPGTFTVTLNIETTQGTITDDVEVTVDGNGHRMADEEERQQSQQSLEAA
jgi:PKD repeat protein